ncbi:hypothetical protein GCM10009000_091200 [Halobacterium noricense]|uniref:Transposase n=1 Tax=Haladaptatus pallidirubidus TaxID=1008152 RepID=A0AAV3UNP1_9EURY|nr:hypothetical protein [Haladaptatus pallidirubidus]
MSTYRRALSEAFESGADTQTAVNDVVSGYTLTSYAKDALKKYVPQLRRTYNASELEDDHPVRFTNRGFRIDHSEERTHEFCWPIPQAGRGNAFWISLRINPAQRELWVDFILTYTLLLKFSERNRNGVLNRECLSSSRSCQLSVSCDGTVGVLYVTFSEPPRDHAPRYSACSDCRRLLSPSI